MGKFKGNKTIKNLKENMKGMSLKEKISYLWFCFSDYTAISLVCLILIGSLIVSIINVNTEILLYGDLINVPLSSEGQEYILDDYGELLGVEKNKRELSLAFLDYGVDDDADVVEFNYQVTMQIVAAASAKSLDYIIANKAVMEELMQQYIYLDLREIMTAEELEAWGENIVYVEYVFSDQDESAEVDRVPVAINLQNTEFAKHCIGSKYPFFLMFIKITPRKEACRHFFDYLMAYEPKSDATAGGESI